MTDANLFDCYYRDDFGHKLGAVSKGCPDGDWVQADFARGLERENQQLRALLAASLEDTARLDWIESAKVDLNEVHGTWHAYPWETHSASGTTPRAAIDAARNDPEGISP